MTHANLFFARVLRFVTSIDRVFGKQKNQTIEARVLMSAKQNISVKGQLMTKEDKPTEQIKLSEEALALKKENDQEPHHPAPEDHPNEGMNSTPRPDQPPSGAFDAEGHRPVLERSRKVR